MKIASRFTIASHALLVIGLEGEEEKVTSELIACSTGVNPVIIRRILSKLKKAGLIKIERGIGGARLIKKPSEITLLMIYRAIDPTGKESSLFHYHQHSNPNCPIGKIANDILKTYLQQTQIAMENELSKTSLKDLMDKANMKKHTV